MWEGVGGIDKLSLIDFPGVPAAVLFYRSCQLRCPYCHNPELAVGFTETEPDVYKFMQDNVRRIQGVVFTGGEPLLWARSVSEGIAWCKDQGLKVKLDTNGLLFDWRDDRLTGIVDACDYVAVDLKLPPERYSELAEGRKVDYAPLIQLLQYLDSVRDKSSYEVRTTVCPSLLKIEDLREMRKLVNPDRWYLQQFRGDVCLDHRMEGSSPYSDSELKAFADELGCKTRGIKESSL